MSAQRLGFSWSSEGPNSQQKASMAQSHLQECMKATSLAKSLSWRSSRSAVLCRVLTATSMLPFMTALYTWIQCCVSGLLPASVLLQANERHG